MRMSRTKAARSFAATPWRQVPVSNLTWTRTVFWSRAARSAEPGDRLPVIDGEAQVPDDGLFEGGERRVSEDEDGHADARPAQRGALVDGVDAEPVDAFVDGDRGDLEDAVTVGVGLDDGQELPLRPDEAAELADVVGQGRAG